MYHGGRGQPHKVSKLGSKEISKKETLTNSLTCSHVYFKKAFTLAEVLITLTIIGIVAALTMPSLIQNYKKHEVSSRLKKFNSMIAQVLLKSEFDNGSIETWDMEGYALNTDMTPDYIKNNERAEKFFYDYIAPYIKYIKFENGRGKTSGVGTIYAKVTLADGSSFRLHNGICIDFIYDVNGEKHPNKEGYDEFRFLLCKDKKYSGKYWATYMEYLTPDRKTALAHCKASGMYCSNLLQFDDWEVKEDYPYKF